MANEILIHGYATGLGSTVKAVLRNATHQLWNGSAFETYSAANIATYDIATTEQGASGVYAGNMPAAAAGWYRVSGYIMAGADLAESDLLNPIADMWLEWTGTAWAYQSGDSFARIGATGSGLTSLASQASVDAVDDYVDTEVAAIKAKTDQLTFSTASRVDAQVFGMEANTVTATAIATDAITAAKIAADAIGDSELAGDAVTAIQSGLALSTQVDDLESRIGVPSNLGSGATVAANLVDIEAQTDDIGAAGAGLTAVPWNAAWDAEVESEVVDGLNNAAFDVFQAKIGFVDDNAAARDRYVVTWFKNAVPITSGITVPVITVRAASDNSALISAAAMDTSGEQFIYVASGAERISNGAAYTVIVTATIESATRTDKATVQIGRDSSA